MTSLFLEKQFVYAEISVWNYHRDMSEYLKHGLDFDMRAVFLEQWILETHC